MSDYHPPASQSLINIRPPKPLPVIYIFFSKFGTLFFSQNTRCPPLSFQILSCNPLLPWKSKPSPSPKSKPKNPQLRCHQCHRGSYEQKPSPSPKSKPKTQNSDAADVIEEAMSNLTQPLKQVLEFSWEFFFKIYLTVHGW